MDSGLTSCCGVSRDFEGNWCFGFSRDLGLCFVLEAELCGVYEGLATTWSLGYIRIVVEMNCRDAYDMVLYGNISVDIMARLALIGTLAYHRYLNPSSIVRDTLDADKETSVTN
ncbi:hypothetical protein V6N12_031852 [Hibiscus sabdariffa]|uniref:RNase H type-1 domain-containing protein n=1 Tax=Hibiscus sabdariffa TaxID=183260 RepID=A0ABR2BYW9_9ROSI